MLQKLAEFLKVDPDVVTLALSVLTLVVGYAHTRGKRLPIISALLSALGMKPALPAPTSPDAAPSPAKPAPLIDLDNHPVIKSILDRLNGLTK